MTLFHILYKYDTVLSIKLNILMWQILLWNTVQKRSDLISMRVHQIERYDENIEEAITHLQQIHIQEKKQYNRIRDLTKDSLKKEDLVLLYNSKLNILYSVKLKFCWSKPYQVKKIINDKEIYKLKKLDEISLKYSVHDNRLKKFWLQDKSFKVIEENEKSV